MLTGRNYDIHLLLKTMIKSRAHEVQRMIEFQRLATSLLLLKVHCMMCLNVCHSRRYETFL